MKIYKVYMDLLVVMPELQSLRLKLDEYNSVNPILFIDAEDPDDACSKALYNLIHKLLLQDESIEVISLCRRLRLDVKILQVKSPS